ncbi:unnamed protein product [Bursaphelenchus okinawaensis]|uniref:N-acetylgalactosaminide beta-1,3-galactosyltransferase n=1 Tax=Bursaphelenchus okinawaensis TaxID=465554 RepID=A0A811L4V1_9BILA|nr:unnamed protein product [Bursaphelenchus okinawaensis]CAG9117288.1 unnamed protein product [Bursaphelenchus okinawaensis]
MLWIFILTNSRTLTEYVKIRQIGAIGNGLNGTYGRVEGNNGTYGAVEENNGTNGTLGQTSMAQKTTESTKGVNGTAAATKRLNGTRHSNERANATNGAGRRIISTRSSHGRSNGTTGASKRLNGTHDENRTANGTSNPNGKLNGTNSANWTLLGTNDIPGPNWKFNITNGANWNFNGTATRSWTFNSTNGANQKLHDTNYLGLKLSGTNGARWNPNGTYDTNWSFNGLDDTDESIGHIRAKRSIQVKNGKTGPSRTAVNKNKVIVKLGQINSLIQGINGTNKTFAMKNGQIGTIVKLNNGTSIISISPPKQKHRKFSVNTTVDDGIDYSQPVNETDLRLYKELPRAEDVFVSEAARELVKKNFSHIYFYVLTHTKNHQTKVPASHQTWMRHVDYAEFHTFTKIDDQNIPYRTLYTGLKEDRTDLWCQMKRSIQYSYLNVSKEFNWYIKVDDDTYVIAENLNKFLKTLDPNKPIYAGSHFKLYVANGYVAGGLIILSRSAVELLVYHVFPRINSSCNEYGSGDVELGIYLEKIQVYPFHSRDSDDKGLFHMYKARETYYGYNQTHIKFEKFYKDQMKPKYEEFSRDSIAFHHLTANELFLSEVLTSAKDKDYDEEGSRASSWGNGTYSEPVDETDPRLHNELPQGEDVVVSEAVKRLPMPPKTNIYFYLMTHPRNHKSKVPAANQTWMQHVDYVEVHTHNKIDDQNIPYVTLYTGLKEDRSELWCKMKRSIQYSYLNVSKKFDWYVKVDDDTYVIDENLNKFLKDLDPNRPIYAGLRLKPYVKNGYIAGGMLIISRKAVELLVYNVFPRTNTSCSLHRSGDVALGKHLEKVDVYPLASRDKDDKGLFHMYTAHETYNGYNNTRIKFASFYKDKMKPGYEEFSRDSIAFHHLNVNELYLAEVLTYIVKRD